MPAKKETTEQTFMSKLLKIQEMNLQFEKNTKAYNYYYTTLDDINKKIKPLLSELGLVIYHFVDT